MAKLDVFPTLLCCTNVAPGHRLYDVKFYPFAAAATPDEQVFAVVGTEHVFVARITPASNPPYEILRWWHDLNQGDPANKNDENGKPLSANLNSLVWTQDATTGKPQLCVAGAFPKQVLMFDVESGHHIRTLVGHGKGINDLAMSPLSQHLLATASDDYTVRMWSLASAREKQPCVAIFAGEGHKQPVLAIGIHPNGRWLLSGGLDTALCLWAVPPQDKLQSEVRSDSAVTVYYPHFHSIEVHHNYIDNVVFYGDLILSRAARHNAVKENEIILWKIDGFTSDMPAPTELPMPGDNIHSRSSFPHSTRSRGFQRLLSFDTPYTDRFYSRFGLFQQPNLRPILVMGTQHSKFLFWDLQRLEEGYNPSDASAAPLPTRPTKPRKGKGKATISSENLNRLEDLRREQSIHSDTGSSTPDRSSTSISAPPERKYSLDDPFTPLKPHHTIAAHTKLLNKSFGSSAIAFSPDGKWVVSVGDEGMMCIFHRNGKAM